MAVGGTRATAFGLDVLSAQPFPFLQPASARPTGREIDLSLDEGDRKGLGWPDDAELISDQREPGGGVNFRIEADSRAGYLIWGPSYGASLLSADGCQLRCVAGEDGADAWQRLLVAQVLPFAAVLWGLEVMHAGAVALGGGAVALLGPSGAGKTSLAMALCRRGARFLADDVLTLETRGATLVAHPGTPVAGIGHAEAERLLEAGELEPEDVIAVNARERVVGIRRMADKAPLRALFFVDRRPDGPRQPRFEPAADAQMLLGATFNLVLASPQRLSRLLEVCALAGRLRVERIAAGPEVDAGELGAAIEARLGADT